MPKLSLVAMPRQLTEPTQSQYCGTHTTTHTYDTDTHTTSYTPYSFHRIYCLLSCVFSFSFPRLYRTLTDLHTQCLVYECESDVPRHYMMLKTMCRFFLHIVASHTSFNMKLVQKEKYEWTRKCKEALTQIETLKVELTQLYQRDYIEQHRPPPQQYDDVDDESNRKSEIVPSELDEAEALARRLERLNADVTAPAPSPSPPPPATTTPTTTAIKPIPTKQNESDNNNIKAPLSTITPSPTATPAATTTTRPDSSFPISYPSLDSAPHSSHPPTASALPMPPASNPFYAPSAPPAPPAPSTVAPTPAAPQPTNRKDPLISTTLRPIHVRNNSTQTNRGEDKTGDSVHQLLECSHCVDMFAPFLFSSLLSFSLSLTVLSASYECPF